MIKSLTHAPFEFLISKLLVSGNMIGLLVKIRDLFI